MIRRSPLVLALVAALLASVAFVPAASARPERKARKAQAERKAEKPKEETAAGAEAPAPADNAALPASDNAVAAADNAVSGAPVQETDITATVVTGRPMAAEPKPSEGPSFFWAAVKMVLALGAVLAILLGFSHYMKKYMDRFGAGSGAPGRAIAVTEARHVAPKTQVMVVEALGSRYLIGITPTQVTLIDKVPAGRAGSEG